MQRLHRIPIEIAGMFIELTSPRTPAELGIEARLKPFFANTASGDTQARVALRWQESRGVPVARGELVYDPGSIWKMYREGSDYVAELTYHGDDGGAQTHGVLQSNASWDDLTLTERRHDGSWSSLLNIGAGELILRTAILFTGGLVLHASGLDDNGRGIVFVGHSGAGKSTQVGLWAKEPGVVAVNDDRVAVRVGPGGPMCYGTPWGGTAEIARNHAAPLAALVVLEQAPANSIVPLTPLAAVPLVAARTFLPYWDPALMIRAMHNLDALLAAVPVYCLRCRPDNAVVPLVRSIL